MKTQGQTIAKPVRKRCNCDYLIAGVIKRAVRDYERLRRAIGPEQVDMMLEAARPQEQAEKERKRAARRKADLDAR